LGLKPQIPGTKLQINPPQAGKYQISSIKFQTNHKLQIPITLTIPIFPVLMKISFSICLAFFTIIRFGVLNFGYCDLPALLNKS